MKNGSSLAVKIIQMFKCWITAPYELRNLKKDVEEIKNKIQEHGEKIIRIDERTNHLSDDVKFIKEKLINLYEILIKK